MQCAGPPSNLTYPVSSPVQTVARFLREQRRLDADVSPLREPGRFMLIR